MTDKVHFYPAELSHLPFTETADVVTGKAYRSIGVILVVGGILYLLMATKIGPGLDERNVGVPQPIPMEYVKRKTMHVLSQRQNSETDIETGHVETVPFSHINRNHEDITPSEILTKDKVNPRLNSSVKVNRNVKVIGDQHSNERSIFPNREPEDIGSNLPNWEPEYKNRSISILSDKKIVIIVAYMRTGSTLTASVLEQYPGTFYAFEPIRSLFEEFRHLEKGNKTYTSLKYIDGSERDYTLSEMNRVKFDEINNWLTCHLDSLSMQSLMDKFHTRHTKIMKTYNYCVKGLMSSYSRSRLRKAAVNIQPHLRKYYDRSKSIGTCLRTAIGYCQRSPLLILKFIRLQMKEVIPLLPLYPNMKIIHLVRDPRGIFNSRFKVHAISRKSYQDNVKKYCSHVENDLEYSKQILEIYKDRLKIVPYEDMAESPLETARSLVEFAGIEFIKPMQEFVRNQTSSTRNACAYCTQRRNSTITAHKWRKQLDPEYATYIYETCKMSNSILGYLPLTSTKMKDSNIPSRKIVDVCKELLKSDIF